MKATRLRMIASSIPPQQTSRPFHIKKIIYILVYPSLYLDVNSTSRAANSVHHPFDAFLNERGALLHELRQGRPAGLLLGVFLVLPQDDLVDVEAGHAGVDTLLEDLGGELVGAVHDKRDFPERGVADALQAREVQLDVLDAVVRPVDVTDRGGQEVDACVDELQGLFGRGQDPLQVARVLHARLPAVDAPRLGLGGDAQVVAELDQLGRPRQVLLLLVVAHVDHDGVEFARECRLFNRLFALRVVQVQGHGDFGAPAHVGRQVDQVVVRVFLGPWEQQDLARRVLRFGGLPAGDDRFQVVTHHARHAVAAFLGGLEDPDGDVL